MSTAGRMNSPLSWCRGHFGEHREQAMLDLASHAALPVALSSELLHLIRINFFYTHSGIDYSSEAELLLSPLCREVGEDLYEILPEARAELLKRLYRRYPGRVAKLSILIGHYAATCHQWLGLETLKRSQLLAGLLHLDNARVQGLIEQQQSSIDPEQAREEHEWLLAMRRQVELGKDAATATTPAYFLVHQLPATAPGTRTLEVGRLLNWWRETRQGLCLITGAADTGKTGIAERLVQRLVAASKTGENGSHSDGLPIPKALLVFSFTESPDVDGFFENLGAWLKRPNKPYREIIEGLHERDCLLVLNGLDQVQETGASGEVPGQVVDWRLADLLARIGEREFAGTTTLVTSRVPLPVEDAVPAYFHIDLDKPAESTDETHRTRVFISYSHQDAHWLERLRVHLKPLTDQGLLDLWDDTRIAVGEDWNAEIEQALASAKVVVLLISANFLASKFIHDKELPLLEAVEKAGTTILPLIVAPCPFMEIPSLARFQTLNEANKPLSVLSKPQQEAMLRGAAKAILDALRETGENHIVEPTKPPSNDFQAVLGDPGKPGLLSLTQRLKRIEIGINPYATGTTLPGNSPGFFGRDQALHETLLVLRRPGKPGCVSVVAERRMGKSSFIEQVRQALAAEPGIVTIHADLQSWDGMNPRRLYSSLHRAITDAVTRDVGSISTIPTTVSADTGSSPVVEDFRGLRDVIKELTQKQGFRFVLLLDEFEALVDNPAFGPAFYHQLRALASHPDYHFGIVTTSRHSLSRLFPHHNHIGSPLWTIFGFSRVLGLLTDDQARDLLTLPMLKSLSPKQRPDPKWLWNQVVTPITGCHPALLQMAAAAIWNAQAGGYELDITHIRQGVRDYLIDLWEHLDTEQKRVLHEVVENKEPKEGPVYDELVRRGMLANSGKLFSTLFGEVVRESWRREYGLTKQPVKELDKRVDQWYKRVEKWAGRIGRLLTWIR